MTTFRYTNTLVGAGSERCMSDHVESKPALIYYSDANIPYHLTIQQNSELGQPSSDPNEEDNVVFISFSPSLPLSCQKTRLPLCYWGMCAVKGNLALTTLGGVLSCSKVNSVNSCSSGRAERSSTMDRT